MSRPSSAWLEGFTLSFEVHEELLEDFERQEEAPPGNAYSIHQMIQVRGNDCEQDKPQETEVLEVFNRGDNHG